MDAKKDGEDGRGATTPARRPRRGKLLVLCISAFFAFVLAEVALRALLFLAPADAGGIVRRLREPGLYASVTEGEFFKLHWRFHAERAMNAARPDPRIGWAADFDPVTFAHPDEAKVGARRPVILYGDSNAMCLTAPEHCFQGILEGSDLADRYALVNYGVGGYGLDQMLLVLRGSIDRFAGRDPIVVIGVLVEDDLARSMVDFRGWPKPLFGVRDGRLVEPEPVDVDVARYLDEHPASIRSYVARLVTRRAFGAPRSELERLAELNALILDAIHAELDSRGFEHFFLLFGFDESIRRTPVERASRATLTSFFERSGVRHVDVFEYLKAVCDPEWRCLQELTGRDDPVLLGHMNDGGNRLAFEALRQGLERRFDAPDFERVRRLYAQGAFRPDPANRPWSKLLERAARGAIDADGPTTRWDPSIPRGPLPRLAVRATGHADSGVEIRLGPPARRLVARVRLVDATGGACPLRSARLVVARDGVEALRAEFALGDAPRAVEVDLAGARTVRIRAEADGAPATCAWIELASLALDD